MSYQLELYEPELAEDTGVKAWFTMKNAALNVKNHSIPGLNLGLYTDVPAKELKRNLDTLAEAIETPVDQIAWLKQVHGSGVREVKKGGFAGEYDALVTAEKGLAIAIQVADCAALLFYDSVNKVAAAAHAGWRGAVAGIVKNTIQEMVKLGSEATHIKVFVSPCISEAKFEVGEEVARQFPERFVNRGNYTKPHINLKGFLAQQLVESDIAAHHIEIAAGCTLSDASRFYSYRREKANSGRMMAIIKMV